MNKFSDRKAIRAWVLREKGCIGEEISKLMDLSRGTVNKYIAIVNGNGDLLERAKTQLQLALVEPSGNALPVEEKTSIVPRGYKTTQLRKWLEDHPNGTRSEFITETGVDVGSPQFSTIRTSMMSKNNHAKVKFRPGGHKERCEYTDEGSIKAWRLFHYEKKSKVEIGKIIGCDDGTVRRWITVVDENPALLAKAQNGHNQIHESPAKRKVDSLDLVDQMKAAMQKVDEMDALRDENAFLLWWNDGERKGWVDRLLKKVQE